MAAPLLRLGFVPNPFSVACYAAVHEGCFEDAGLEVRIVEFANGSRAAEALDAGELDCTVGGHLQTIRAVDLGSDQRFFAPLAFEERPDHSCIALVAGPGGPRSVPELSGCRIGVSAVGAISELQLRVLADMAGIPYDSLSRVTMPFAQMSGALKDGTIAAASLVEPFVSQAMSERGMTLLDEGSLSRIPKPGLPVLITGLVAPHSWLQAHKSTARAAIAAIREGIAFVQTHEPSARAMIAGYTRIPGAAAETMKLPRFRLWLAAADLELVIELAAKFGMLEHAITAGDVIEDVSDLDN
jgi:NitT/TauT family transport system substrate-binding protein